MTELLPDEEAIYETPIEIKTWVVYMHVCKDNSKRYIGITSQKPIKRRWRDNGSGYFNNGHEHLENAILKHGWDNFDHIILHIDLTEQEAKEKEAYYIKLYDTTNREYGYNMQAYDERLNILHSKETKKLLSEIRKKYYEDHPEAREKKRQEMIGKVDGEKNPMYGRRHKESTKRLISIRAVGRPGYNKGEHLSEKTKQLISKARRGIISFKNKC